MLALLDAGGLLFIAYLLIVIPFALGCFAVWVGSLVHCIRNRKLSDSSRIIWAIVICVTHIIGAVLYLIFGRNGDGGGVTSTVS